jgi:UDP-N-acetylenolpyruvoylglucosamine reductase
MQELMDRIYPKFCLCACVDPKGHLHRLTSQELGLSYRHCDLPKDWIFIGARLQGQVGKC